MAEREKPDGTGPGRGVDTRRLCKRGSPEAFDVDGTLGRLAKWLRILGFDADYPVTGPRAGRVYVTRNKSCADAVRVHSNDPLKQLKQVLGDVGVQPDPDLFLCRCLICNVPVSAIDPIAVGGRVPPDVLAITDRFNECPRCGRVYWEGTHSARIKRRLQSAGIEMVDYA